MCVRVRVPLAERLSVSAVKKSQRHCTLKTSLLTCNQIICERGLFFSTCSDIINPNAIYSPPVFRIADKSWQPKPASEYTSPRSRIPNYHLLDVAHNPVNPENYDIIKPRQRSAKQILSIKPSQLTHSEPPGDQTRIPNEPRVQFESDGVESSSCGGDDETTVSASQIDHGRRVWRPLWTF